MADTEVTGLTGEVMLMAALENVIRAHYVDLGYHEGQILDEEHTVEVERAVAWLASKYGD